MDYNPSLSTQWRRRIYARITADDLLARSSRASFLCALPTRIAPTSGIWRVQVAPGLVALSRRAVAPSDGSAALAPAAQEAKAYLLQVLREVPPSWYGSACRMHCADLRVPCSVMFPEALFLPLVQHCSADGKAFAAFSCRTVQGCDSTLALQSSCNGSMAERLEGRKAGARGSRCLFVSQMDSASLSGDSMNQDGDAHCLLMNTAPIGIPKLLPSAAFAGLPAADPEQSG